MHYILALLAALIGGLLDGPSGFFFAGLVAFGIAMLWQQRQELNALRVRLDALAPPAVPRREDTRQTQPHAATSPGIGARDAPRERDALSARETPGVRGAAVAGAGAGTASGASSPTELSRLAGQLAAAVRTFATTGNPVVRIGVVVLFFGVAFLLRYAWEQALLPLELRLAGAALAGVALTATGWRLRDRSDTYGLVLQGAGIGILYLTIFAAARLYDLMPLTGAFALLAGLTAGAAVLAVMQNAQALAMFAMSGGFLAPVLVSTGAGSHVALFSYYAVLNTGIVAMAWYRHWRWLNWVGFIFTFVIGAFWGYQYYRPELLPSTEPFLILFFLYYVGVSVLFARRQSVKLKSLVDGTLVFGTPMAAFALQWGLVRDLPFGMAYSALAAAAIYTALALWLRKRGAFSTLLGQSFLALGVAFATLAIPFAFDNQRWTAATWALEGAGLLWVGIRQQRLLPRLFGVVLQLAAAAAFAAEFGSSAHAPLLRNSHFLGTLLLALSGVFSGYLVAAHGANLRRFERHGRWLLLFWGVLWWLYGFAGEVSRFEPRGYEPHQLSNIAEHLFMVFMAVSFTALVDLGRRRDWREAIAVGYLLLPIAVAVVLTLDISWVEGQPLAELGWAAWPATMAALYWHLLQSHRWPTLAPHWHAGCWWFVAAFLSATAAAGLPAAVPDHSIWRNLFWALVPLAFIVGFLRWHGGARALSQGSDSPARWPIDVEAASYVGWGAGAMLSVLGIWLVLVGLRPSAPAPLPYVLLVNPAELTQLSILLVATHWARRQNPANRTALLAVIAATAFVWVNLVAVRAVHFYAGVPYPAENIVRSDALQTTVSILWSSIALVLMGWGTRQRWRLGWLAGAGLLAVVLLKLFTLDLSNLGLVARIVSFISVGLLMLLIGYLAPLPPAQREAR